MAEQLVQQDTSIFIFNTRKPAVNDLMDLESDQGKKYPYRNVCMLLQQQLHSYLRNNNLFTLHSILSSTNFVL